jgi:DMSO/TMAO reductase YedYZ molybdopterin-dependent catalytic subunit
MSDESRPEDTTNPPGLSAGWLSLARTAVRGVASFLKAPPAPIVSSPDSPVLPRVISPDTLREVRVPKGQHLTTRWPVLHAGPTPKVDLATWNLKIFGEVEEPKSWSWDEFRALPALVVAADMHCVTTWSRLDNAWEGVPVREVMKHVVLKPEARFVLIHAEHGFTTNLPLDDFLGEDCLFAWSHDGHPLTPDHGWPLRLVVPRLYAWKSAKWVRGIEFLGTDRPGFWEQNGYHNHGDPWTEERFW